MSIFDQNLLIPKNLGDYLQARNRARNRIAELYKMEESIKDDLAEYGNYLYPVDARINNGQDRALKDMDRSFWKKTFDLTGFSKLMDQTARNQFENSLDRECPEYTEENIRATFLELYQEADMMFQRGIVQVFKYLSDSYKTNSNEPFRIGDKIILTNMVTSWHGYKQVNYGQDQKLSDIDRVFQVMAGKEPNPRALEFAMNVAFKADEDYEDEFYKARAFKNGNMHLWFKRPDLLEKVNDQIAAFYGSNKLAESA